MGDRMSDKERRRNRWERKQSYVKKQKRKFFKGPPRQLEENLEATKQNAEEENDRW